jgi:steroid delta-isomerase-like uncharacterized protein
MNVIETYFNAFNNGDVQGMLDCLSDDVAHHVNEGQVRIGKDKFASFCEHMNICYQENLTDIVVFTNDNNTRGAAEFTVNGTYLKTDGDLPAAHGQRYCLPAGSFFSLADGKITRVVTYYNLSDWIAQVS